MTNWKNNFVKYTTNKTLAGMSSGQEQGPETRLLSLNPSST